MIAHLMTAPQSLAVPNTSFSPIFMEAHPFMEFGKSRDLQNVESAATVLPWLGGSYGSN